MPKNVKNDKNDYEWKNVNSTSRDSAARFSILSVVTSTLTLTFRGSAFQEKIKKNLLGFVYTVKYLCVYVIKYEEYLLI